MNPRFLAGVGLRSSVPAPLTDMPGTAVAFQRSATCAMVTAVAAETQDQRVSQRIKDRQTERFR